MECTSNVMQNDQTMDSVGDDLDTYDVSGKGLCKLDRCSNGTFRCLILDRNELTRLENVETYGDQLFKLSASENKLVRMYGVCRLLNVQVLDLSKNSIVSIEGLRELVQLRYLNLSGNKIKAVEHLVTNVALEHLDLSNNCICIISDINKLKSLKNLQLDYNNIKVLGNVHSYFPASLEVLSVANNSISDLNQMSYLNELVKLQQLSITGNTCINMTGNVAIIRGFDYRPFVLNWCQSVKNLDGYVVGSKESLKAEWLYSMGKGRHFQPGEHAELVDYLSVICPLTAADNVMSAEDAKLARILSKRREHQQQLLEELSTIMTAPNNESNTQEQLNDTTLTSDNSHLGQHRLSWTYDDMSHQESTSIVSNVGDDSDVEAGAVGDETSLVTESLYVPVPETMLSPDFRPVHVSPQCSLFDLDVDSAMTRSWDCNSANVMAKSWDGGSTMTKSWDATATPNWLQRSSIPRKVASASSSNRQRPNRTSLTDSPILRRPTQVQRLQRSTRPLSLSPSYGRRPPSSSPKKVPVKTSRSSSDEDSTDSDVSVSKLTLVKKAAELRMATIATKQKHSAKKENVMKTVKTTNARDKAAVVIQAAWRGHSTRKSTYIRNEIRVRKTEDHIRNLEEKLAETQKELELEKRLRALQMEAIRSLWKEVQQMQTGTVDARATPSDSGVDSIATSEARTSTPKVGHRCERTTKEDNTAQMISHLVTTCNTLQQQVQHLQESLHLVSSYVMRTSAVDNQQQLQSFPSKCPPVTHNNIIIPQTKEEEELTESECNVSSQINGAINDFHDSSTCTETKESESYLA